MTPKTEDDTTAVKRPNMQYLATPSGDILPMQIWSRVTHKVNEKPYAIVCLFVDLDNTEL